MEKHSFSVALRFLKGGKRVAREGWNGKGMWLEICSGAAFHQQSNFEPTKTTPFVLMKTADDKFVPWLCSQTDMLAEDWVLLDA